jgi:hypothetical protein
VRASREVRPMRRPASKCWFVAIAALTLNACGSPYYTADPIEAWVVDAETGAPIEGAVVTANWQLVGFGFDTGGRKVGQLEVMETVTDRNGRFAFPGFTNLNPGFNELRGEDPQILIFKPGYRYIRAANDYPLGKEGQQGTRRKASINGRTLKMEKANPDIKKYAWDLSMLSSSMAQITYSGRTYAIPKMIHALECERRRLVSLDFAAGFLSVPGAAGLEFNCEK